jgi:transcriptional regulator with XRE-family HTH domain
VANEEKLAKNVRRAREAAGLSQEELGARAKPPLHRTEISLIERGQRDVRLSTLLRLSRALKVEPADLLDGIR